MRYGGGWFVDHALRGIRWVPPGDYDESKIITDYGPGSLFIPEHALAKLPAFLDETGYIKPRLDERLRTEDLKITHRLLDLLDKVATK